MEKFYAAARPADLCATELFVGVELQVPYPFEWEEHLLGKLRATLRIPATFRQEAVSFADRRPAATATHGEKLAVAGRCSPSSYLEFVCHDLRAATLRVYYPGQMSRSDAPRGARALACLTTQAGPGARFANPNWHR
jgi:hypothetical protein